MADEFVYSEMAKSFAASGQFLVRDAPTGVNNVVYPALISPAWLAQLRASTVADPWLHGFAVVHREHDLVIGSAGFVGPPNEDAAVEIAYGIVPGYQGRGYATEAAAALTNFAFTTGRVQIVCAYTLPQNEPSARVLAKCGFKFAGEVIHPEDGLVLRWQCTLERNADDSP